MLLDHRAAQRQAQTHALGLGGEEGGEQALGDVGGNARAAVDDAEHQPALGCRRGTRHPQRQPPVGQWRVTVHRLDAVARQVEQHLLHHGAVNPHPRHRLQHVNLYPRADLARLQSHQRQHRLDQHIGRRQLMRLLAAAYKVVHALDHAAGALGLLGDALQPMAQRGQQFRVGRALAFGGVHQVE